MQLIAQILIASILTFGGLTGGTTLYIVIRSVLDAHEIDNEDVNNIAFLLIAIAICLVGAVHVMPA
jgi:hypothetical protein